MERRAPKDFSIETALSVGHLCGVNLFDCDDIECGDCIFDAPLDEYEAWLKKELKRYCAKNT